MARAWRFAVLAAFLAVIAKPIGAPEFTQAADQGPAVNLGAAARSAGYICNVRLARAADCRGEGSSGACKF